MDYNERRRRRRQAARKQKKPVESPIRGRQVEGTPLFQKQRGPHGMGE